MSFNVNLSSTFIVLTYCTLSDSLKNRSHSYKKSIYKSSNESIYHSIGFLENLYNTDIKFHKSYHRLNTDEDKIPSGSDNKDTEGSHNEKNNISRDKYFPTDNSFSYNQIICNPTVEKLKTSFQVSKKINKPKMNIFDVQSKFLIDNIYFTKKSLNPPTSFLCVVIENDRCMKIICKKNWKGYYEKKTSVTNHSLENFVDEIKDLDKINYIILVNIRENKSCTLYHYQNIISELKTGIEKHGLQRIVDQINDKFKHKKIIKILNLNSRNLDTNFISKLSSVNIFMNIKDIYFQRLEEEYALSEKNYEGFLKYYYMFQFENNIFYNFFFVKLYFVLSNNCKLSDIITQILYEKDSFSKKVILEFLLSKKIICKNEHAILMTCYLKMTTQNEKLTKIRNNKIISYVYGKYNYKDYDYLIELTKNRIIKYADGSFEDLIYIVKPIYDFLIKNDMLKKIFYEYKKIYNQSISDYLNILSSFSIKINIRDKLCDLKPKEISPYYVIDETIVNFIKILLVNK